MAEISPELLEQTREILGTSDRRLMLTVSRLVPRKGIDTAIHAFALIHQEYPDLVYLILGSGPDQPRLTAMAKAAGLQDKVRFLRVPDTKPYYHLCDFFVMPNRTMPDGEEEGFGIVFLEAALARKPSIAGNSGGAVEAVLDEKTGFIVDGTDPEEVSRAMKRLLDDPAYARKLGNAAYDFAQNFTQPVFAQKYAALVDRVLEEASEQQHRPV